MVNEEVPAPEVVPEPEPEPEPEPDTPEDVTPDEVKEVEEAMRLILKDKFEGVDKMTFAELKVAMKLKAKSPVAINPKVPPKPRPAPDKGGQPDAPTKKRVPTMMERGDAEKTLKALNRASGFVGQLNKLRTEKDLKI